MDDLKFKVGDRVRITEAYRDPDSGDVYDDIVGMVGTVVEADAPWHFTPYRVKFDNAQYFKNGWLMKEDELEAV